MFKYFAITFMILVTMLAANECEIQSFNDDELDLREKISNFVKTMKLDQAILITLQNQREIQISQMQVAEQRGFVQSLAGPFDPFLNTGIDYIDKEDRQYFPSGIRTNLGAHETVAFGEISKLTRIGTQFSLRANIDQIYDLLGFLVGNVPDVKSNQGIISFIVQQPLLNGFLWGNDVTQERAAKKDLAASVYDNLFVITQKINDTVNSYWEVIAAKEQVKVREENLENFKTLEQNTQTLIDSQQLAKAEIYQPQAQVAQAEEELILLKQQLFTSIQILLWDMGLAQDGLEIRIDDALEADLPEIPENFPVIIQQVNDLIKFASIARPDILASYLKQESAAILVKGGYNATLPQLNIVGGVTKQDFYTRDKANPLHRPLRMHKPETDYSVGLRFSYPICNNGARGALYQRKATLRKFYVITQQLIQTTYKDILDQWSDLIAVSRALEKNAKVIEKNSELVEFETIKLKAGYSTLFVLIDFQNRLANAKSERAELKKRFMQNVANIRFLSGTLITPTRCLESYSVSDVTKLPTEEEMSLDNYDMCINF